MVVNIGLGRSVNDRLACGSRPLWGTLGQVDAKTSHYPQVMLNMSLPSHPVTKEGNIRFFISEF